MGFEFIYRLPKDKNLLTPEILAGGTLIIPLSDFFITNKRKHLLGLNQSRTGFCFEIGKDWIGNKKWTALDRELGSLISLLFLPGYLKKKEHFIFIINQTGFAGDDKKQLVDFLGNKLKKQGITRLYFEAIEDTFTTVHNEKNHFVYTDNALIDLLDNHTSEEDGFSSLFARLINCGAQNRHILIPVASPEAYSHFRAVIKELGGWIERHEPFYSRLLEELSLQFGKEERLLSENRKLRFKIENYNDYLRITKETTVWHVNEYQRIISLSQQGLQHIPVNTTDPDMLFKLGDLQNQVNYLESNRQNIIDWYNKEYEALPLWYKRFGHIIKVLMGKRTFKSLFQ